MRRMEEKEQKETKLMGVDYGSKKVGVALSDITQSLAFPYKLLRNEEEKKLIEEIKKIKEAENVDKIVIGESLNYKMENNPVMKEIKKFASEIENKLGVSVEFELEALTTAQAARTQEKKNIDASAAAIILQSHLDRKR